MLVLSANKVGLDMSFIMPGKSLMWNRKNNGPRIEPCGTPCFIFPPFRETIFRIFVLN